MQAPPLLSLHSLWKGKKKVYRWLIYFWNCPVFTLGSSYHQPLSEGLSAGWNTLPVPTLLWKYRRYTWWWHGAGKDSSGMKYFIICVTISRPDVIKRDTITADHRNSCFLISTLCCQMPPNTRINLIQRSHNKIEQVFCGESTRLQGWKWITIDFWTECPEIKAASQPGEILNLLLVIFSSQLVKISSLLALFASYCKTLKFRCGKIQAIRYKPYDISDLTVSL